MKARDNRAGDRGEEETLERASKKSRTSVESGATPIPPLKRAISMSEVEKCEDVVKERMQAQWNLNAQGGESSSATSSDFLEMRNIKGVTLEQLKREPRVTLTSERVPLLPPVPGSGVQMPGLERRDTESSVEEWLEKTPLPSPEMQRDGADAEPDADGGGKGKGMASE
jgi:hypothetical protein